MLPNGGIQFKNKENNLKIGHFLYFMPNLVKLMHFQKFSKSGNSLLI